MDTILSNENLYSFALTTGSAVLGNFALNLKRKRQSPQKVVMSGIEVGLTRVIGNVLENQFQYQNAATAVSAVNHIFIKNKTPGDAAGDIATTQLYINFGDFLYNNFLKSKVEG